MACTLLLAIVQVFADTSTTTVFSGTLPSPNGVNVYSFAATVASLQNVQLQLVVTSASTTTSVTEALVRDSNSQDLVDVQLVSTGTRNGTGCLNGGVGTSTSSNYSLVVMGSPGVTYSATVVFSNFSIAVNGVPVVGIVDSVSVPNIYYFDVTADTASQWPVDVLVTSTSTDVVGLMFVQPAATVSTPSGCPTYFSVLADSENTARLTFEQTARIILSPASSPPISSGRWYIGVLLNSGGTLTSKSYTLAVQTQQHQQYPSAFPGWQLFVLPLSVAIAALVISHLLPECFFSETSPTNTKGIRSWINTSWSGIPRPSTSIHWPAQLKARYRAWFGVVLDAGIIPFSFSWQTLIVGGIVSILTWQITQSRWTLMRSSGNLDGCFYNSDCYQPLSNWDVPFNNVISNIGYILLGLAFNLNVAIYQLRGQITADCSLFFAIGWAMCAEGVFSAMYHVCPSVAEYQFDVIFMFVIASVTALAVYQTGADARKFVSAKYYLFFIFPLLVFDYVGVIRNTTDMPVAGIAAFATLVSIWELLVLAYIWDEFESPMNAVRALPKNSVIRQSFCGTVGYGLYAAAVVGMTIATIIVNWNVSNTFLGSILVGSLLAILRMAYQRVQWSGRRLFVFVSLLLLSLGCWSYAVYVYSLWTSDKTLSPWASRDLTRTCYFVGFFDEHDVWHAMSALALFFFMMLVLHINPPVADLLGDTDEFHISLERMGTKHPSEFNDRTAANAVVAATSTSAMVIGPAKKFHAKETPSSRTSNWRESHTDAGERYYYNTVTGATTWIQPPNFA